METLEKWTQRVWTVIIILAAAYFVSIKVDAQPMVDTAPKRIFKPKGQIWVMVVDTGIHYHPRLANYVQYDSSVDYKDTEGHGTHVAGIIAYGPNMATDAFKDALCPQVKIFSCNYFRGRSRDYLINNVDCIKRAINMKIDYVNVSSGGGDYDESEYLVYKEYISKGGKVFAAAGNEGNNLVKVPYYPASYAIPGSSRYIALGGITVVSNVDRVGDRVYSSNYWTGAVRAVGKDILSTVPGQNFEFKTGTSMATPVVLHGILKERCKKFESIY